MDIGKRTNKQKMPDGSKQVNWNKPVIRIVLLTDHMNFIEKLIIRIRMKNLKLMGGLGLARAEVYKERLDAI